MFFLSFMTELSLSVIKTFQVDAILRTPFLLGKAAGVAGFNDLEPLLMADIGSDLVHKFSLLWNNRKN
jgi:hypothetical protein